MDMIKILIIILAILILMFFVMISIKNINTYNQREKIIIAIERYLYYCSINYIEPSVKYSDREQYSQTLYRLWDWGYTRILPKEKYNIIKEYII